MIAELIKSNPSFKNYLASNAKPCDKVKTRNGTKKLSKCSSLEKKQFMTSSNNSTAKKTGPGSKDSTVLKHS